MAKEVKEIHKDLLSAYSKSKDILEKHLIIASKKPSPQDIWYAYGRCSQEELKKLANRKDNNALMFLHCRKNDKWSG